MKKFLIITVALFCAGMVFWGCNNPEPVPEPDPNADTVITLAAIGGVTVPVTGAAPATTITETTQYTGTITWSGNPSVFAPATVYTATITLEPKKGYTLEGVAANFFTVAGTMEPATNLANSGIITAKFNTTAGTQENPAIIDISVISVTAPVTGATPVTTITETSQFTGTVFWAPMMVSGTFAGGIAYRATIILIPKEGFTLGGVADNFFTVTGAEHSSFSNSSFIQGAIFAAFPPTSGTFPQIPELPVLFENGQWAEELGTVIYHVPNFESTVTYDADGLITVTNNAPRLNTTTGVNSSIMTFRFVWDELVDMRGYNKVIIELEDDPDGWFMRQLRFRIDNDYSEMNTNYTKVLEMGPPTADWYQDRLRGVGILPDTGKSARIKKIYLAEPVEYQPVVISHRNLMDIIPPRTGNTPVREITTSSQYTATVSWSPDHAAFQPNETYTATINLTPRWGYTLTGVAANWFRIYNPTGTGTEAIGTGSGTTHDAGSGNITKTFPATVPIQEYPPVTGYIAYTFDDAPSGKSGNELLDAIEELGIKVTFMVSGNHMDRKDDPERLRQIQRMIAGGHEFGNHSYQHERLGDTQDEDLIFQNIKKNHDLILEMTGQSMRWMRFPYANSTTNSMLEAAKLGLITMRGVATDDWDIQNSASFLINRVVTGTGNNELRDGQVYTGHEQRGQTNSAQAIREIYHYVRMAGLDFKTLSELYEWRQTVDPEISTSVVPGQYQYLRMFSPYR